jgi:hypothetical protein
MCHHKLVGQVGFDVEDVLGVEIKVVGCRKYEW